MAKLYMMIGYPGAGKTTTATVLHNITGAAHLSSDAIRAELFPKPTFTQAEHDELYHYLDHKTEELLKDGKDVIYDANLNRLEHRKTKYDICERTGAEPVLLWLQTPRDMAKERAAHTSRQHLWPPGETPQQMFERIAGVIQEPEANEPYIKVDGTKVTNDYIRGLLDL